MFALFAFITRKLTDKLFTDSNKFMPDSFFTKLVCHFFFLFKTSLGKKKKKNVAGGEE